MTKDQENRIDETLATLFEEAQYDHLKVIKGETKSVLRPKLPSDFKDAYLSISKEQGEDLVKLIKKKNIKNIVEFGTSFGISTLFLAKGVIETGGRVITAELIESKAHKAVENFKEAGVNDYIEIRIGDALETLSNYQEQIDLLLLDGWKDLYLPLFKMLEDNFHTKTIVYVDNADMEDVQDFLKTVKQDNKYQIRYSFNERVALITISD